MTRKLSLWACLALLPSILAGCGAPEEPAAQERQAHAQGGPNLSETYGLLPALHIKDDLFVDEKGEAQPLHGFSWFGFNTGTGAPDGLWGNDPLGSDFERIVRRQKLLGFNAVRLPFSFAEFTKEPRSFNFACSDLSDEDVAKATLAPNAKGDPSQAPKLAWPAKREAGQCNGYLPTSTTRERYIWTVLFYVRNNFYVLVDNHYREDQTAETDEKAWVQGWADLAHDLLVAHPETQGRVFFDLLNEPGQYGQAWEKNQKAGIHHLYVAAMDAVWAISDKAIFALEGSGQDSLNANWGDGYCTDADKIQKLGLSDPRPFFVELAGKPYKGSVSLAPHVYGPAVTHAPADFSGQGLTDRLDASFGTLTKEGFAVPGGTLKFPVMIGEFGSKFIDQSDVAFMKDFAKYLQEGGDKHNKINHWFYWDWNADSGDTGGLVTDSWKDIEWTKIDYLVSGLRLTPWWLASTPAAPPAQSASPTTSVPASPASQSLKEGPRGTTEGTKGSPAHTKTPSPAERSPDTEPPKNCVNAPPAPGAPTIGEPVPTSVSVDASASKGPPAIPGAAAIPVSATPPVNVPIKDADKPKEATSTPPLPTPSTGQSPQNPPNQTKEASGSAAVCPPSIPPEKYSTPKKNSENTSESKPAGQGSASTNVQPLTPPSLPAKAANSGTSSAKQQGSTVSEPLAKPTPATQEKAETEPHLTARIGWDGHWTRDGFDYFTVNIHLSAHDQVIRVPYTVVFKGPQFDLVQEAWNLEDIKTTEGSIEGRVVAPWGTLLANTGAETVLGMIYRVKSGDGKIKEIIVDGQQATIQ